MEFVIGAASGCSAVVFSNPLEVIKTRLQLQGELARRGQHAVHYRGVPHAAYVICRTDGIAALQRGLGPALAYQLGTYQTLDDYGFLRDKDNEIIFVRSICIGAFSGGLGSFMASPFNQIKTQMQAMSSAQIAVGKQHSHASGYQAFINISRENGIKGLYRGSKFAALRIAVGNSVQLTTFNRSKDFIREMGWFPKYPMLRVFLASCAGGVLVALVACPLDVVLTRMYNQGPKKPGSPIMYAGIIDCAEKIFLTEGPRGFYKGLLPLYFRTAPHVYKTTLVKLISQPNVFYDTDSAMEFVIGAASGCSAVVFSNPLEVIKTRLQLQGELARRGQHAVHYRGVPHAAYVICRTDGLAALQRGLGPALAYQFVMNATRLGIYQKLDQNGYLRKENGETSIARSICIGAFSGGLGAFLASPFNQIKTQMQAMSSAEIAVGKQHAHANGYRAFVSIATEHGLRGLYSGSRIAALRIAVGSAIQLTTFSRCKDSVRQMGWFPNHARLQAFLASCVSGVFVAAGACPLDVVLTRLYNQGSIKSESGLMYRGILDCCLKIYGTEGPRGFYKGLVPLYFKTAPHVIILMFFWENYKALYDNLIKN